jgi:predicted component of type VI protein secretion system
MITCERCNTENLDGSQYCDECGALLGGASRPKKIITGPTENGDSPSISAAPAGGAGDPPASNRVSEPLLIDIDNNGHSESVPARAASATGYVPLTEIGRAGMAHAKLVIHRGRSVGKEFPMSEDETQIGRWDADGGIFPDVDLDSDDPEAKVSRRHARITRRGDQYFIEDLGSTNGTFINRGRRLLPGDRQPLRDGDEVIVGKTFLRFHVIN